MYSTGSICAKEEKSFFCVEFCGTNIQNVLLDLWYSRRSCNHPVQMIFFWLLISLQLWYIHSFSDEFGLCFSCRFLFSSSPALIKQFHLETLIQQILVTTSSARHITSSLWGLRRDVSTRWQYETEEVDKTAPWPLLVRLCDWRCVDVFCSVSRQDRCQHRWSGSAKIEPVLENTNRNNNKNCR